jgi:cell division septum initiation protein DivIVA
MTEINIINLIEKNPIVKLSNTYNNKLLIKIKETFNGFEQQLFVSNFYCYLNYDKNLDFIVNLDDIWKWLGFSSKFSAFRALELHFKIDVDYKKKTNSFSDTIVENGNTTTQLVENNLVNETVDKEKKNGGQNRQIIMLTVKCFKSLCLKVQTKKSYEIHDYYMKMEELLHKVIGEETEELKKQLEEKDNIIIQIKETSEQEKQRLKKDKAKAVEKAIIAQFPVNTECIYFGTIDNTNESKETLVKFGHSNDLSTRVQNHHKVYDNFILVAAFRVQNKVEIENIIKAHPKIKRQIRGIEIKGKRKTEIISYDSVFTIEKLTKHITDIIHAKTYSIENFNRLLKENSDLQQTSKELTSKLEEANEVIKQKTIEIEELKEKLSKQTVDINNAIQENSSVYHNSILPEDENTKKFHEFIDTMCIVRHDLEEASTNMEGQFRIWCKTKPKKETFHALKNYLDTRFKPTRLSRQNKEQIVHGYVGVKLKDISYKKRYPIGCNDVETFLFQVCVFSPNGKILNTVLLDEFQRWKKSVGKECDETDMNSVKDYLNTCEYALKATVWTDKGSNEGYYGVSLRANETKHKTTSSTGKKVEKVDIATGSILGSWETIAKAAQYECVSTSKMSIGIKNQTKYKNEYYYKIADNP